MFAMAYCHLAGGERQNIVSYGSPWQRGALLITAPPSNEKWLTALINMRVGLTDSCMTTPVLLALIPSASVSW